MDTNLYHSFNARNLSLFEVANSFIINSQYRDLISLNHSLLLGPRGCGKTTLLKMLTPQAINLWNENLNNEKIILPFYGVYIPTDNQWKKQFNQLEKTLSFSPDFTMLISKVIVNTNIIKSIVSTFYQLLENSEREDDFYFKYKKELCIDLIEIFKLDKPISPDLLAIELSLRNRISNVNELINKTLITKTINFGELPDYFYSEFFDISSNAFHSFKRHFSKDLFFKQSNFRWALCFDELELAPEWLQESLINQLRSRNDQTILFKLTSTPIVQIEKNLDENTTNLEASTLNDYGVIRAWTYDQSGFAKWNEFADKFAFERIKNFFDKSQIDTEKLFGKYDIDKVIKSDKSLNFNDLIDFEDNQWDAKYRKGTLMWNLIKHLAIHDKSFRGYLSLNNISYHNPIPRDENQMGKIFRKMKPIIIYRSQFIRNNKKRGRKNVPFYFGVNNIYEVCDGNPRFLSGLIDQLLKTTQLKNIEEITPEKQSEVIYRISERYLEIISSHPDASYENRGKINNLEKLIKEIGMFFYDSLITNDFTINPIGSFIVDNGIDKNLANLINLGVRLGAFVYIDPKEAISENGVYEKAFRLSYLMHPYFKLPLREYNSRNLSYILRVIKKSNVFDDFNLFSEEQ